jgi:hypothetical protein
MDAPRLFAYIHTALYVDLMMSRVVAGDLLCNLDTEQDNNCQKNHTILINKSSLSMRKHLVTSSFRRKYMYELV